MRRPWVSLFVLFSACGTASPPASVLTDATVAADITADVAPDASPDVLAVDVPRDEGPPPDVGPGPYPEGPYGNSVGATLADLRWEGYTNDAHEVVSTELEFGPTSMGAVRATGAPLALVHLSGFL